VFAVVFGDKSPPRGRGNVGRDAMADLRSKRRAIQGDPASEQRGKGMRPSDRCFGRRSARYPFGIRPDKSAGRAAISAAMLEQRAAILPAGTGGGQADGMREDCKTTGFMREQAGSMTAHG
jgi:hypothetical protein